MAKAKITNISTGPRGAYLGGVLVMAEVGETIEADDFSDEWFAKAGTADTKSAADPLDHDGDGRKGGAKKPE
ncbi:hypothetical protein [Sphingobium sp. CFD-1]|uniref:hypothetical protein n=1 Tax=Sphingobium sp. CFD-1 TaxID=2878545 RepID=UPI00214B6B2B|nr:hypothetical protein [Sphingobium sp. CFD-1]